MEKVLGRFYVIGLSTWSMLNIYFSSIILNKHFDKLFLFPAGKCLILTTFEIIQNDSEMICFVIRILKKLFNLCEFNISKFVIKSWSFWLQNLIRFYSLSDKSTSYSTPYWISRILFSYPPYDVRLKNLFHLSVYGFHLWKKSAPRT